MRVLAGGFALAEGPVVTVDGELLVSDVLAGGIRRFTVDGRELHPPLERRRGIGGMGCLEDGRIVVSGRDLSLLGMDGSLSRLAALPDGATGYNDLYVLPDGRVLAGVLTCQPLTGGPLTPGLLALVGPDGTTEQLPVPACWPNGLAVDPSRAVLYLADFATGAVLASPWTGDLVDVRLEPWATSPTGDADGLAVDSDGNVWVAGGAGGCLLRFSPDGLLRETVETPASFVSSCVFWREAGCLVVTTGDSVLLHDR